MRDKKREERRNNVIVRGVRIPKEIEKDKKRDERMGNEFNKRKDRGRLQSYRM